MSGGAGGGSPAPASPTARSGLGRSDSGSRMSFQRGRATAVAIGAVVRAWRTRMRCPWRRLGRCPRPAAPKRGGCADTGAVPAVPGHRTHAQEQSPSRSAPNFGHGGRATTVTADVQPRCDTRARRRRPRHATPPRATHRHGTVTNLGGTTTRRHPRRTPAATQPPPPPPPRGCLRALPCPGKSDDFGPETSCTSKQVLSSVLQ